MDPDVPESKSPKNEHIITIAPADKAEDYFANFSLKLNDENVPLQKRIYYFFREAEKFETPLKTELQQTLSHIPEYKPAKPGPSDRELLNQLYDLMLAADELEELNLYATKLIRTLAQLSKRAQLNREQLNRAMKVARALETMLEIQLKTSTWRKVYLALDFGKILVGALTYLPITNFLFVALAWSEWVRGLAYDKAQVTFKPEDKTPKVPLLQRVKENKGKIIAGVAVAATLAYFIPAAIGITFLAIGVLTAIRDIYKYIKNVRAQNQQRANRKAIFSRFEKERSDSDGPSPSSQKGSTYGDIYAPVLSISPRSSLIMEEYPSPTSPNPPNYPFYAPEKALRDDLHFPRRPRLA